MHAVPRPIFRVVAVTAAAAAFAVPASAATFSTPVDGLEVLYGGITGDVSETAPFDFGESFQALWEPFMRFVGTTDVAGSTLTFDVTIEGEVADTVSIIATTNAFNVLVPVPPAVGLLDGNGTVTLVLETAAPGGFDAASSVTSATLAMQGIPVITVPFEACGTLIPTDECIVFQEAIEGGIYAISDIGEFGLFDEVHVAGELDLTCITVCLAADSGCIAVETIESCACPGDTNGDDAVDVTDLVNVVLDWGTDGSGHGGDVTGDGIVDVADLVETVLNWGTCGL